MQDDVLSQKRATVCMLHGLAFRSVDFRLIGQKFPIGRNRPPEEGSSAPRKGLREKLRLCPSFREILPAPHVPHSNRSVLLLESSVVPEQKFH